MAVREKNKSLVPEAFETLFNKRDYAAAERFWSPHYIQHTAPKVIVNVHSIRNSNQFQIVRRKDFPFRVVYLHSKGLSGAFVQNLKTFLAAGEEMTFSPLAQSNDDREQLPAFLG